MKDQLGLKKQIKKTEDLSGGTKGVEYQTPPDNKDEGFEWLPSDKANQKPIMRILSLKSLIILLIIIFLAASAYGGWFYYSINYAQKPSTALESPGQKQSITKQPASLTLELQQPEDNLLTFQSSAIISGKTAPDLPVLIGNQSTDIVIYSKSDGNFSTVLTLEEGVNIIKVAVFDDNGDKKEQELTVFYSEEKL